MNGLKTVGYMHNGILFRYKEVWTLKINGNGEHYVKQNKPKTNITYSLL
jgi:hypothetical protein